MTLQQELIDDMKALFGSDQRRIDHALAVLGHATAIVQTEPAADRDVVTAAAILHDIGIQAAERKHGSSAGRWQELEGPRSPARSWPGASFRPCRPTRCARSSRTTTPAALTA